MQRLKKFNLEYESWQVLGIKAILAPSFLRNTVRELESEIFLPVI